MEQAKYRKVIAIALLLSFILTSFGLTGCTADSQEQLQQISFAYTLTEQDIEDAMDAIVQLETYIDGENNRKIASAVDDMDVKMDYVYHQYVSAEIAYYSDLSDESAYEQYVFAEDNYMTLREKCMDVLKKLYQSDLSAKDNVFENWTAQELKELETVSEAVIALEREQQELMRQYLALENPESVAWSKALADIYIRFINNAQQVANHYEYDNYYDYAANEVYMREYTAEQRAAFRENVKDYILPFFIEVEALYYEKRDQLTKEQKAKFDALRKEVCQADNIYLTGYMDSYPEEMRTVMYNLFDRDAVIYTQSDMAHAVAYTNYSGYYDQPFVFLGNGYQDLLTVIHELGHYAAYYHFADATLPYDTAEVHSQTNEWLLLNYLDGQIDRDVYEAFLLWRLDYGLSLIVVCTVIDEYEERIYTNDTITSQKQLRTLLYKVLDEYENIELLMDYDDFYIYSQYVTMESPVYYLSYASSELVSMLFYTIAEEQGYETAQEIYINLCLETPIGEVFFDTLMDVGLPNPFETDTVREIIHAYDALYEETAWNQAA